MDRLLFVKSLLDTQIEAFEALYINQKMVFLNCLQEALLGATESFLPLYIKNNGGKKQKT